MIEITPKIDQEDHLMTRFRYKPKYIELVQWFKNGDHPKDGDPNTEGEVVGYCDNPDATDEGLCNYCYKPNKDHGLIDQGVIGTEVCPGDWVTPEKVHIEADWEDDEYCVFSDKRVKELFDEDEIPQLDNN
jgi:hypothetical protein